MSLLVRETGPQSTVQDRGRFGHGSIGVGRSGAADRASFELANRLVANPDGSAAVEITFGGFVVRAERPVTVAITGAYCPVTVDGRGSAMNTVLRVPQGAELRIGVPASGLRTYLAVRGGVDVEPVLGSRSTDLLGGLGPEPLAKGTVLPVGPVPPRFPTVDTAPVAAIPSDDVSLAVVPGPRADWFTEQALHTLLSESYEVTADIDRVGLRLTGPPLTRACAGELPSEGMVRGSLQVPPSNQPTLFLNDHPVTGGYPVIATVIDSDVDRAAQFRPGQRVRFALSALAQL